MAASSGLGLASPLPLSWAGATPPWPGAFIVAPGPWRGAERPCAMVMGRPTTAQRRTIGVRAQIEGPRSSGPDPKRAREPSGSPRRDRGQERECEAKAVDAEKAGNAGRARASAAGMLAVIVPGVAEAVHGKSGTCSKAL